MKKNFLLSLFLITTIIAIAVGKPMLKATVIHYPTYDLQKDKPWLDSIKRIVRRGFEQNEHEKNNWKKQLVFINSCVELGRYYERLFDLQMLPNMKKALYYYDKVDNMARFPDDPKYFKALAIRTTLFRKLSAIYFKGKGVKKDKKRSMYYALDGIANHPDLFEFYSRRYYGCNCVIIEQMQRIDSTFSFNINPFAKRVGLFNIDLINTKIRAIANRYQNEKGDIDIVIEAFPETSLRSQAIAQKILNKIKSYLIKRCAINSDSIITNSNFEITQYWDIDIRFVKKGSY